MTRGSRIAALWATVVALRISGSLEHLLEDLDAKDDGYTGDCPFHEGESRRAFHVSLTKNA